MKKENKPEITGILEDLNRGDDQALERLVPFVYEELKKQARNFLSKERKSHTLQPTALVHEAFLKLSKQNEIKWENRRHFFGVISRLMRQILVDHARTKATAKRGNKPFHFSIEDLNVPVEERAGLIILLSETLQRLEEMDTRQAKIVEMRFFGGFSNKEIAETLEISERTVTREWQSARLWLFRELNN